MYLPQQDWASHNAGIPTSKSFSTLGDLNNTGREFSLGQFMLTFPLFSDYGNKINAWVGADAKFTFKMVWPTRPGSNTNIWRQLSNPMINTSRGVRGYEKLVTVAGGRPWNGASYWPRVFNSYFNHSGP